MILAESGAEHKFDHMRTVEALTATLDLAPFHTSSGSFSVEHPLVDCIQDSATVVEAATLRLEFVGVPLLNLPWSTIS